MTLESLICEAKTERTKSSLQRVDRVDDFVQLNRHWGDAQQIQPVLLRAGPLLPPAVDIPHDRQLPHLFHRERQVKFAIAPLDGLLALDLFLSQLLKFAVLLLQELVDL